MTTRSATPTFTPDLPDYRKSGHGKSRDLRAKRRGGISIPFSTGESEGFQDNVRKRG
jgi:hypothetical protein